MSQNVIVTGASKDWAKSILALCGVPDSEQEKVIDFELRFRIDEVAKLNMTQIVLEKKDDD